MVFFGGDFFLESERWRWMRKLPPPGNSSVVFDGNMLEEEKAAGPFLIEKRK